MRQGECERQQHHERRDDRGPRMALDEARPLGPAAALGAAAFALGGAPLAELTARDRDPPLREEEAEATAAVELAQYAVDEPLRTAQERGDDRERCEQRRQHGGRGS